MLRAFARLERGEVVTRRTGEAIRMMERIRRANFDDRRREVLAELEREQLRANLGDRLAPLDAL